MSGGPFDVGYMALIARAAWAVFHPQRDKSVEEALELPNPGEMRNGLSRGCTVYHLCRYLQSFTGVDHLQYAFQISRFCAELERSGFLIRHPYFGEPQQMDVINRYYLSGGEITNVQGRGDLWLSGLLGAGLVIPTYGSVTIAITGTRRKDGRHGIGSGLIIGQNHILTAKHNVDGMVLDTVLVTPTMAPPRSSSPKPHSKAPPRPASQVRITNTRRSKHIDLAVLEVEPAPGHAPMKPVPDIGFRDPQWGDTTYVFGYPPGQLPDGDDGPNLIVQRGEVVNPEVRGYDRRPLFLYSAIARPGASGGPIVAQDGRVIGMVIEEGLSAKNTLGEEPSDAGVMGPGEFGGFYIGIPAGEILAALDGLGLGDLAAYDP
ncbi:S1 family peptidase [Mycolicibacterium palauense]|uniref:S1 family peptidase n=1 Tax=Mycolicibacterium palauense TaxID=2034511 RepID=UPI000BFEF296|nr:serine protease [Mycolicibacterium palauense]